MNPHIPCILGFLYLTGIQIPLSIGYPTHQSYGQPSRIYAALGRKVEPLLPHDVNELRDDLEEIAGKNISTK